MRNEDQEGRMAEVDRRTLLTRAVAAAVSASPLAVVLLGCDSEPAAPGMDGHTPGGTRDEQMPGWMMDRGSMDRQLMRDMRVIHRLLLAHEDIARQVENVPGGIRARTTSTDPVLAGLIRTHVQQMRTRIERGDPIRQMDPLFREIFHHHRAITMRIDQVPGGVTVTETSSDPQVELLIRQHAQRAVSEFVAQGMRRAMDPTPLPPTYR